MLSSYRVVDLSDERGIFCGYVLAHLGAEVIAIEPPGGCAAGARRRLQETVVNRTTVFGGGRTGAAGRASLST